MTNMERDNAAGRRGELDRGGLGRRLSPAIDARRRGNAQRPATAFTSTGRIGPHDRRYEYLTHSHD